MEAESSLPYSQEPATGPYPEPDESTGHQYYENQSINQSLVWIFSFVVFAVFIWCKGKR